MEMPAKQVERFGSVGSCLEFGASRVIEEEQVMAVEDEGLGETEQDSPTESTAV